MRNTLICCFLVALALCVPVPAPAQTVVDNSNAITIPFRILNYVPGRCQTGEYYENSIVWTLYECNPTVPNTWRIAGGGGGYGTLTNLATGCGTSGGPITATGTILAAEPLLVKTSNYAQLAADCGSLVQFNDASAVAYTLLSASSFGSGIVDVSNIGAGSLTITGTVDGGSISALATGQGLRLVSNGTVWASVRGVGGGGTGNASTYVTTTFSATPTFTANTNTSTSFLLNLTGNVTSSTLASATTGQILTFKLCQDATGSRLFVPPANVLGMGTIDPTASACSQQTFVFDGTNAQPLGVMYVTGVAGGAVNLPGSSSGSLKLKPAAAAGTGSTITFPAGTTDFSATGGSSNCVQQLSTGAPLTVAACPGGSSAAPGSCGPTGAVSMTGSNVSMCALTGVPALPAGQCYTFHGMAEAAQNYQVFIYVDSTLVSTPIGNNNPWGGYFVSWEANYCNNAGVRNAQQLQPINSFYQNTGNQYGAIGSDIQAELNSPYPFATAVDWSTAHTITVYMNAASGNGEVFYFKVN